MAEPSGEAEFLKSNPLLNKILDDMEMDALNTCVNLDMAEHEMRQTTVLEVRAIRSLRRKLHDLAKGSTNPAPRGSVA
jgi:hypothetical protein